MAGIRFRMIALRIDGEQHYVQGDFTLRPHMTGREAQVGSDGHVGVIETPMPAEVAGNIIDHPTLDASRIKNLEDVTLTCELANGKTWVVRNAFQSSSDPINLSNGQIPVNFIGQTSEELFA